MNAEKPPSPTLSESPSYVYRPAEKLRLLLPCLRQKIQPRRNLFAGPFAGEFGNELMQWQGFVRARRSHYESVHVLTYPGRDYLYEGCQVHHHDINLKQAGYGYGRLTPAGAQAMARAKAAEIGLQDYDIFEPSLLCSQHHKKLFWRQEFKVFQEPPLTPEVRDIAFHFRALKKEGPDNTRNYLPTQAEKLVQLCREHGFTMICIGHPDYSICPAGVEDFRSVDLRRTIAAISSVRVISGEISGPLHLANLCGQPTVFFADGQWRISYCRRWNPFQVPQYVAADDTMQPAPERVFQALVGALQDLRQRTENFSKPCYTLPAQPIANF